MYDYLIWIRMILRENKLSRKDSLNQTFTWVLYAELTKAIQIWKN